MCLALESKGFLVPQLGMLRFDETLIKILIFPKLLSGGFRWIRFNKTYLQQIFLIAGIHLQTATPIES